MRLRVLGSSGGYPAPGNPNTGFLLEHGAAKLWLDAGTGTFAELQRVVDFTRVDALVVSHAHADHCADLYPLHVAIRYGLANGFKLPVYAPPGALELIALGDATAMIPMKGRMGKWMPGAKFTIFFAGSYLMVLEPRTSPGIISGAAPPVPALLTP